MSAALDIVYAAIDQLNAEPSDGPKIAKDPSTPLLDVGGLDSLALVNLVVAVEQLVFDKTQQTIVIADESVFSSPENPFRTVGSLAAHIETMLG